MRACLLSLFALVVLAVDASSTEKNVKKRGVYHPQQHISVYASALPHGHGNHHGIGIGYGQGHGSIVHGGGLLLGGKSQGFDLGYSHGLGYGHGAGYGHGFDYNHHANVVNHVVKVPVSVPQPVEVHRDVPVPVPHLVPVVVKRPVKIPVPHPVPVVVQKPYHVPVNRPVPVYVPTPVHVPHPVPVPVSVPEPTHHHLPSGPSHVLPSEHSHVPFRADFGGHGVGHGSSISVGQFHGHLGGHEALPAVRLPSTSYGFPAGKPYYVDTPAHSYDVPSPSYGSPGADFSDSHGSGTFDSSLSVASPSVGSNDGYDYPVPSKKFI